MTFPTSWQTVPLHAVAEIGSGITKGRKLNGAAVTVPYLRVANVQAGHVDLSEVKEIEATAEEVTRYGLQADDILMTEGGDPDKLGRGALWDGRLFPCIHQNHIFRVRLAKDRVYPPYFAKVLGTRWAVDYFLKAAKQTTGIATINKTQLSAFPVPLPPLPEQKRIAAILDKADAIKRKRQEAIRLTEDLLRAAFLEMFGDPVTNPKGWKVVAGGDVFEELRYGTSSKCDADDASGLPVLRIPNIVRGNVDWTDLKYVHATESEAHSLALETGDVLFVRSNGNPDYIGRCAVYDIATAPGATLYASYLIRGRLAPSWNPWFIQAQMSSEKYRGIVRKEAQTTAGNYNISTAGLRNLRFIKPPLSQQEKFAAFKRRVEKHAGKSQRLADEAQKLTESLAKQAFSGGL